MLSLPIDQWPEPAANPEWVGQAAAEQALLQSFSSGRLPHGWLITGPQGTGKATLAYRFARFLLADNSDKKNAINLYIPSSDPTFKKIAAGGHNDLKVIAAGSNEKKKTDTIGVEEIRALLPFMRLTAGQEGWRIVIIDGADEMNRNAQNALLKVLEEPGERSLIMLLAENAGALLPTIRSRCRLLNLQSASNLPEELFADLPDDDRAVLYFLCAGSLGNASRFVQENGGKHYYDAVTFFTDFTDPVAMHKLGDIYAKSSQTSWNWFAQAIKAILFARIKNQFVPGGGGILLISKQSLIQFYDDATQIFAEVDQFYLEKKQTLLSLAERLRAA